MSLLVVGLFVLLAAPALAEEEARSVQFGNSGVLDVGASTGLNLGYTTVDGGHEVDFTIQPEVAYFVTERLSIGGLAAIGYSKPSGGGGVTTYGIGPMVGYNFG